jgi:chorismate mutase
MISNENAKEELKRCREEIAKLDKDLVALLKKRVDLAMKTGALKREAGLPILDPGREATVIREAVETARTEGLSEEQVREIFWRILALSRSAQEEKER